jgi:hypothetical protein
MIQLNSLLEQTKAGYPEKRLESEIAQNDRPRNRLLNRHRNPRGESRLGLAPLTRQLMVSLVHREQLLESKFRLRKLRYLIVGKWFISAIVAEVLSQSCFEQVSLNSYRYLTAR